MTNHRLALLFIILVAFALRFWQLPQTPPGLWYDEAYNAMDAIWMAETGNFQPFVVGNNGRETMWHYLLILSISVLGSNSFAVRLVGSLAGLLTIPITYRFALAFSRPFVAQSQLKSHRHWLAVAVAGWMAVSWWHLLNSRAGFRPVLLPLVLMLSLYFFWRGWTSIVSRKQVTPNYFFLTQFSLAGLFLGLAQYTYLSARVAPLIFGGVTILWTFVIIRDGILLRTRVRQLWLGTLLTAITAMLVFVPLGLFFFYNPASFSSRTEDVLFTPDTVGEVVMHVLHSISLFLGAGHELYRHHLPGRAMLGWLEIPFFWLGLIILLRPTHLRRPQTQLILLGLGVMWIPAILASPPVHSLRPIGLFPFYYIIVTVGLYQASHLRHPISHIPRPISHIPSYVFPVALTIIITINGLINSYDYFRRWTSHPEVYKEFNGPLVDLTNHLIDLTERHDVIIPFHVYAHPTVRYLLQSAFTEVDDEPPPIGGERPVEILLVPDTFQLLYVGNIPVSPALVLLTRDETGQGIIYVSRPPRTTEQLGINEILASAQSQSKPFRDKLGRDIAYLMPLPRPSEQSLIFNLFTTDPLRTTNLNWADLVELRGYDVTPQVAQPGQPITINLYWHSLTDFTFDDNLFLQLVDTAGNPLNQWEGAAFGEDIYRWRPDGILPSQHILWLGPDTPPGPYLIRLGFFDQHTGERLPLHKTEPVNIQTDNSTSSPDQVYLGLFYVSPDDTDPRIPTTPLSATFADVIQLIGVTLPDIQQSKIANLKSKIHWQALQPTTKPYTVFLQLLDEQGEIVTSWDSQPFGGLYPTHRWSPGEVMADTFLLPLPEAGLPPGNYRLITGFYDFDTGQRLPVTGGGDFAVLSEFVVE